MWLFVLFLAVPLIEIALFIQVGGLIGLWPTLLIVVLTAILGTFMMRQQGLKALQDLQSSFVEMRDPTEPLAHGAMILFSGALLLTPGFFTDAVGFSLLIPGVRRAVFRAIKARVKVQSFAQSQSTQGQYPPASADIIDGEYQDVQPTHNGKPGNSGWTKN